MEQSTPEQPQKRKLDLKQAVTFGISLGLFLATFIAPGGDDLQGVYRPLAEGCVTCAFVPYYASWLLAPLRLIPPLIQWPVVMLVTIIGVYWLCKHLGTSPLVVLGSFPMIALVWLGQPDLLVIGGLILALEGKNPYLRGLGWLMASIKPQVAGPALLLLLIREESRLKALAIPVLVFAASLVMWGLDWPIRWLTLIFSVPYSGWPIGTLYPVGLLAFGLVFLVKDKRKQLTVALLATSLGVPRFIIYSHVEYMALYSPWWALPLSYAWLLAWPWMGRESLRLSFTLPLVVLGALVWPEIRALWARIRAGRGQPQEQPE